MHGIVEREHYSRRRKPDRYLPWTSVSSSVKMSVVSEMTSEVSEVPSCCLTRLVKCQPMAPENSGGRAKQWGGGTGKCEEALKDEDAQVRLQRQWSLSSGQQMHQIWQGQVFIQGGNKR